MKPKNWKQLPRKEKLLIGSDLFTSRRGKYVVSQALALAMASLNAQPTKHRSLGDVEDMEILHETIFDMYPKDQTISPGGLPSTKPPARGTSTRTS